MNFKDLVDSLNEYDGLISKIKKGRKKELVKGEVTTTNTISFFNRTESNVRVNTKNRVISIEYQGRIILDYEEVSLSADKKAKQLAKLVIKGQDEVGDGVKTFIESEKEDLKKQEKELKAEIKELKAKIKILKKELETIKRNIV